MELRRGYRQTDSGAIPEEWITTRLDSVAMRGSGHTPDKKHPEYWDGEIKWISLRDSDALDKLYIDETAATITPEGVANSSAVLHPPGTVVLSRDAGVGKSAITNSAMAVSQHFIAWQCGPRLDNHYLYYWLQAEKSEFERIAIGNTIKTIGLPYFRALEIRLPPLAEQRAISSALRDVDALLGALTQLIVKKRDLKQAAMQQLLTGQTRLPGFSGAWEVRQLRHIVAVRHGKSQRGITAPDGRFPILATSGEIGRTNRFLHDKPSVLIGRKGTINFPQYVDTPFWTIDTLFYTEVSADADARFLFYKFNMIPWQSFNEASGVPSLNASTIESIELSCPGVREQSAIAAVLSEMDEEIAAIEERLAKTRALKQGMMQELLTGRTRLI